MSAQAVPEPSTGWQDRRIPTTVRVPADLHEQMRVSAFKSRESVHAHHLRALRFFLSGETKVDVPPSPFGVLQRDEIENLRVCLEIMRTAEYEDRKLFMAMVSWWKRRRQ